MIDVKLVINNLLIIDVAWFNSVGVVICKDVITNEYKSYIKGLDGNQSAMGDMTSIASYGSPFPLDAAQVLFKHYKFNDTPTTKEFPEEFV